MATESIAVLEIGTSTVRVLVGALQEDDSVLITRKGEEKSFGIRKGELINREHAIDCVRKALLQAEEELGHDILSVYLITSGGLATSQTSTGVLNLIDLETNQNTEISEDHINEVIEIARKVALPETSIRLHTLQQSFQTDDVAKVESPVGMAAAELRANMLTISGKRSTVENFRKVVDDVPVECNDAFFSGLCVSKAILQEEHKQAGVLIIDIGGGTTDYIYFHDNFVQAAGSFPVGGDHITSDITEGLSVAIPEAERLKITHGHALTNSMERETNIQTEAFNGAPNRKVRSVTLNTIINARMDEIFTLVKNELYQSQPNIPMGAGVFLTGGGALLQGACDLGQKVFNVPCAIGKPLNVHGITTDDSAALYAGHIGAFHLANVLKTEEEKLSLKQKIAKLFGVNLHE